MKVVVLVALLAVSLFVAGCGSSVSTDSKSAGKTTTTASTATTTTATTASVEDAAAVKTKYQWPEEAQNNIMRNCTAASNQGITQVCAKFLTCMQDRIPFAVFVAADKAMAAGTKLSPAYSRADAVCQPK
jgi:uncharacterized protein YceK